ncbi:hypothetical protein CPT_Mater33 [Bacillus phage Mater]|uniref:Uncharacterized protein n=1 Tax=Bacillus phage Mater TaxID=1540090 RepID=A0A0A0RMA5_9CAUD|nr:hypothetical protein CPT_Mater33 [Bacillus phage Mater]AIW03190.1 hypothetical protein CPT_Mater33 [Bacillus phage Mater]
MIKLDAVQIISLIIYTLAIFNIAYGMGERAISNKIAKHIENELHNMGYNPKTGEKYK